QLPLFNIRNYTESTVSIASTRISKLQYLSKKLLQHSLSNEMDPTSWMWEWKLNPEGRAINEGATRDGTPDLKLPTLDYEWRKLKESRYRDAQRLKAAREEGRKPDFGPEEPIVDVNITPGENNPRTERLKAASPYELYIVHLPDRSAFRRCFVKDTTADNGSGYKELKVSPEEAKYRHVHIAPERPRALRMMYNFPMEVEDMIFEAEECFWKEVFFFDYPRYENLTGDDWRLLFSGLQTKHKEQLRHMLGWPSFYDADVESKA
ncbi:hypothetical protein BT63DRAFT_182491, partial [Microthyrium microscopicum]